MYTQFIFCIVEIVYAYLQVLPYSIFASDDISILVLPSSYHEHKYA